jgi:hypothetical protein
MAAPANPRPYARYGQTRNAQEVSRRDTPTRAPPGRVYPSRRPSVPPDAPADEDRVSDRNAPECSGRSLVLRGRVVVSDPRDEHPEPRNDQQQQTDPEADPADNAEQRRATRPRAVGLAGVGQREENDCGHEQPNGRFESRVHENLQ